MIDLYYKKKKLYLLRAKKLREVFNQFYLKTIQFGPKGLDLYEIAKKDPETLKDYIEMCETDDDVIFMTRLMNAVLYVNNYNNEEVVNKLLDDIELNIHAPRKGK